MQKHPTNLRQAETAAAPAQAFESPQAEIEHIKQTDRTMSGFARILEIIRDSDFYDIEQGNGALRHDWLTGHRAYCGSCVGALLAWFYDTPVDDGDYRFRDGVCALANRLGIAGDHAEDAFGRLNAAVNEARRAVAGEGKRAYYCAAAFSGYQWGIDYADVFHELARMYPGK